MRTSTNTRVLVTLSRPIPSLLLCLSNLRNFWQKQVLLSYVNCCVHSPSFFFTISSMQWRSVSHICWGTTKSPIHQVWGRDYPHRVTEMLPSFYTAQLVLLKCHLNKLERRNAGKSEVAFHILLINGGGMRHTMLMGKNLKNCSLKRKKIKELPNLCIKTPSQIYLIRKFS